MNGYANCDGSQEYTAVAIFKKIAAVFLLFLRWEGRRKNKILPIGKETIKCYSKEKSSHFF